MKHGSFKSTQFMKQVSVVAIAFIFTSNLSAQRQNLDFNEDWQFFKAVNKTYPLTVTEGRDLPNTGIDLWETVNLPHTFNRDDMQLDRNFFTGTAIYQKKITPKVGWKDQKRLYLKFGGVGSVAKLYVNNKYIGEHKGGYSQFVFEITNSLDYEKENIVSVVVDNNPRQDIIPVNNFLFPVYGGLYRGVHLIVTDKTGFMVTDDAAPGIFIDQKNISAQRADLNVRAKLNTTEVTEQKANLEIKIQDASGKVVSQTQKEIQISPQGVTYLSEDLSLKNPHLWQGVFDPYLYSLTATLKQNGKTLDEITQNLGLRKVEIIPGKGVFLNGKKYPMHGVTRHQDRWGHGSALSYDQHKEDFELMKEMGTTTVRLAHYQQADQVYELADRYGFLVWAEIPYVNTSSYVEYDNAKQQMTELVKQNYNHPSIYIWGTGNEVYSKTKDGYVPVLLRQLNDIAKTLDPYRYTGSVNGYNNMNRPENRSADVQGINQYFGWYNGKIEDLEPWAEGLEKNYGQYKIFLTEYGADGNIDIGAEEVVKPKNVVSGQSFPENYQTETHIRQWAIIEKHPIITASYLWNMFEFAVPMWNRGGVNARNLKGLITFDRKRKKDSFYWYKANWNPEPMVYLANRRDNERTHSTTKIQAFSNLKKVTFIVNGKEYAGHNDANEKHWVVDQVLLQKGENKIEAVATDGKQRLTDTMIWTLK